jgi:hypothetical protein
MPEQEAASAQANFIVLVPKVYNPDNGFEYEKIQEAINAGQTGDTFIVNPGIFMEKIVFDGKDIIFRSSDPSNPDIVAGTIIDGGKSGSVVRFIGGDTSTLESFTIRNGNTGSDGGGLYMYNLSPDITNNTITDNGATIGGGIYVSYSSPIIEGNIITDNTAISEGGGIAVSKWSTLTPTDVRPIGWGASREKIPTGVPLVPTEGDFYNIAGNEFFGNKQDDPLSYNEGAHVYFY